MGLQRGAFSTGLLPTALIRLVLMRKEQRKYPDNLIKVNISGNLSKQSLFLNQGEILIFTESASRPIQSISHNVRLCVG